MYAADKLNEMIAEAGEKLLAAGSILIRQLPPPDPINVNQSTQSSHTPTIKFPQDNFVNIIFHL